MIENPQATTETTAPERDLKLASQNLSAQGGETLACKAREVLDS